MKRFLLPVVSATVCVAGLTVKADELRNVGFEEAYETAGEQKVAEIVGTLITTMKKYERDPARIRAARFRLADLIERKP